MAMVGSNSFKRRLFALHIPLAFYAVFLLFPFAWMLIVSVKPDQDLLNTKLNPFRITNATIDHYLFLFEETDFLRWTWNTFVVTISATAVALVCSIFIGYALGRLRFRGGNILGVGIFRAYVVIRTLLFIAFSQVIARFYLYNRYWALMFNYPT